MKGKSGSGKTTLLTLIGTLRRIQSGEIRVNGRNLGALSDRGLVSLRKEIGFIFQAHNLFASLTAFQNVRIAMELVEPPSKDMCRRATEILGRLDLAAQVDAKPHRLSGGQRQRVAIARALVNRPKLVLADEPTAALDEASGRLVMDLLREVATRQKTTIMIVTHDEKILEYTDRLIKMKYGTVTFNVDVHDYLHICSTLKGAGAFSSLPPDALSDLAGKMVRRTFPAGSTVIRQGEPGDTFYLIRSGVADVLVDDGDGSRFKRHLHPGDYFGEGALLLDRPRTATVTAREPLDLYALGKDDFGAVVAESATFEQQLRKAFFSRT